MPVTIDETGRRSVTIEVPVPCTLAAAWKAIATGDGISAWFVPTTFDGVDDGVTRPDAIRSDFGPGMESLSTITAWNPPRSMEAESADLGVDAPLVETTWEAEPDGDDRTIVRVRHAVRTDSDAWDAHLSAWEGGWPAFFRLLRLRLEHWPDAPCAVVVATRIVANDADEAWSVLESRLGLEPTDTGAPCASHGDAPPFAGTVADSTDPRERIVLLETPGPGLAHLFTMASGEHARVWIRLALFGTDAMEVADRVGSAWTEWLDRSFDGIDEAT